VKKFVLAVVMGTSLVMAMPVQAQEQNQPSDPDALALEGIEKLMDALRAFLGSIPQYEAPVINENGDIIIRRKHPKDKKPTDPEIEETSA
jgi:hypothetical protein